MAFVKYRCKNVSLYKRLIDVINAHAPLKTRVITYKEAPYMNDQLRKSMNVRNHFRRKWERVDSKENRAIYVKHRNSTMRLRKQSMLSYLQKNCINTTHCSSKQYWTILKPFMSNKGASRNCEISLLENDQVVNNQKEVASILNDYYVNISRAIGEPDYMVDSDNINDIFMCHKSHRSVLFIKEYMAINYCDVEPFKFRLVSKDAVLRVITIMDGQKATGNDSIPPKLLKASAHYLCDTITFIINKCIIDSSFPDDLKLADVIPLFKKDDMLNKQNYRPVSILSCVSKVFERLLIEQLELYFSTIFSPFLTGYRKHHGCQDVLVHFVTICQKALDNGDVAIALLTDLSKAFDSLPYKLLLCKLKAYGICNEACDLIKSYFCNRKQRVRIGNKNSEWRDMIKGVPQGSIMGPFIFNIFYNDLLLCLSEKCNVFNYADDTSILCVDRNYEVAYKNIVVASNVMLEWFSTNFMQANPSKFQFIVFEKESHQRDIILEDNVIVKSVNSVKLLGVTIDNKLRFKEHISTMCQKAGKQMGALARLSNVFNQETKMLLMQSFILSHFLYCSVVYHYCSRSDIIKLEKVQKKGLRFVHQDFHSSYTSLREMSNRPLLYVERQRCILQEVYKSIHDLGPRYLHDLFAIKDREYDY